MRGPKASLPSFQIKHGVQTDEALEKTQMETTADDVRT